MTTQDKAKNAVKWINELLNTDLPQGTGILGSKKQGFCCLGLGCHILNIFYGDSEGDSEELKETVGLLDSEGKPWSDHSVESLVTLNDELLYSFKAIADRLITEPEEYFESEVAEQITNYFNQE